MIEINVGSVDKNEIIDITSLIEKEVNIRSGICVIYCPHTTAGITINENYDSDVKLDLINKLNGISPSEIYYKHSEGNSDAHVKSMIVGSSQMIIIEDGKLVLGTWQGIFFYEFDGPRNRTIFLKFMEDKDGM